MAVSSRHPTFVMGDYVNIDALKLQDYLQVKYIKLHFTVEMLEDTYEVDAHFHKYLEALFD